MFYLVNKLSPNVKSTSFTTNVKIHPTCLNQNGIKTRTNRNFVASPCINDYYPNVSLKSLVDKFDVIGDQKVGKTSIIKALQDLEFCPTYIPTTIEDISVHFNPDLEILVADTSGDPDYDKLRPLSYLDSHMALACFAMDDAQSFKNISHRWIPEIKQLLPKAPVILLGLKCDLKLNDGSDGHDEPDVPPSRAPISARPNLTDFPLDLTHLDDEHFQLPIKRVSSGQGKVLAWKLGVDDYVELSAKDRTGIESLRASIQAQLSKLDKHFKWRKVSKMITM